MPVNQKRSCPDAEKGVLDMVSKEWRSGAMGDNYAYGSVRDVVDAAGTKLVISDDCGNAPSQDKGVLARNEETAVCRMTRKVRGFYKCKVVYL